MAQQIINTGVTANDGTGDPLRNAMIKVNANFDELYDGMFSGDYNDLTNLPTLFSGDYDDLNGLPPIPSSLLDLGITDGSNNQVLATDGDGNFSFVTISGVGGGIALTDLSVGPEATASGDGGISYNNGTGVFTYTPPVIPSDVGDLTDNGGLLGGGGGSSLQTRVARTGTTASLANGALGNLDITGFKSYALMAIQTDRAAWVRIYANGASRTADAGRAQTSDPAPDAGVIAEVITTGAQTVLISPGVIGFNFEGTPTTNIPCAVTNLSGAASTVAVTLSVLQLEA